jgi:hypothetical protein
MCIFFGPTPSKEDIVTGIVDDNLKDYNLVVGSFKKNYSTGKVDSLLWFDLTGNLSRITRMYSPSTLVIESGKSTFKVSTLKFVNGLGSDPMLINGKVFTLYNIGNPNNPHINMKPVPSGTYYVFIHALDLNGNSNGTLVDVRVSSNALVIISPNGGETWQRGTSQTIRWNYTSGPGSRIKIELLKNGILNRLITISGMISNPAAVQ